MKGINDISRHHAGVFVAWSNSVCVGALRPEDMHVPLGATTFVAVCSPPEALGHGHCVEICTWRTDLLRVTEEWLP